MTRQLCAAILILASLFLMNHGPLTGDHNGALTCAPQFHHCNGPLLR